jgi:hypothetical protein
MTTNDQATADPRAEYIAGLRMLADLLEARPELMKPHGYLQVIPLGEVQSREQLAAWARALPGKKEKQITDQFANLVGTLRGVQVKVVAYRDEVCERVVLGTETVTKKVKDPQALAAVPEIEVTEEVEQVEWVCRPMLADEPEVIGAVAL